MRKLLYIISIFLFLSACYHDAPEPDFDMSKVLPADTMVSILTDIQLVEGTVIIQQRKGGNISKLSREYTDDVLAKHHITFDQMEESMRYYTFYTKKMNDIYDKVITRLSVLQSENDEMIRKKQAKKKD